VKPRELVKNFGKPEARAAGTSTSPAEVSRAWAQHLACAAVRREFEARGMTAEQAAALLATSPRTFDQKLIGRDWITIKDLVSWSLAIGDAPVRAWATIGVDPFPVNFWPTPGGWAQGEWSSTDSGQTFDGVVWPRLAAHIQSYIHAERHAGRGHLLDDAVLAAAAREALMSLGTAASKLQLRRSSGANLFDVDSTATVGIVIGRDPTDAAARADLRERVAGTVLSLVGSDQGEVALVAVLEPAAEAIVAELLMTPNESDVATVPWTTLAAHAAPGPNTEADVGVRWDMTLRRPEAFAACVWRLTKEASRL
jgi:hypothetical protein